MEITALAEILKKHGVVGAGGAGFPSYAKLNEKADIVILNCAECEPLFRVHRQTLASYAAEILYALNEVKKAVNAKEAIIAVKDSYKDAVMAVEGCISEFEGMSIKKLPETYPAGDEVVLIYEATGRVTPPGQIPISVGVIVYNVETMLNAYYAIKKNESVTTKLVTISGEVKKPQTFKAPLGMTLKELVALAGGETVKDSVYINGGVMTGKVASPYDVVTKTTNAVLVFPKDHPVVLKKTAKTRVALKRVQSACCQCRMCTDLCPRNLLGHPIEPHAIMNAASNGDTRDIRIFTGALYCSDCGLCEMYSCGQMLSPRTIINEFKAELKGKPDLKDMPKQEKVSPARDYRRVPMDRLITRLGIKKYDVSSPISDLEIDAKKVKIMLSQHIGAPATPAVKEGDSVVKGQVIASTGDKLGADIHASIDGVVGEITKTYIKIERTN